MHGFNTVYCCRQLKDKQTHTPSHSAKNANGPECLSHAPFSLFPRVMGSLAFYLYAAIRPVKYSTDLSLASVQATKQNVQDIQQH